MEYFVSDFHFSHKAIINFERVRFKTIEEHDNHIMSILESKLTENDTLYFLGDIGISYTDGVVERFKNLPCKKFMIMGNHDIRSAEYYKNLYNFNEVYETPIYLTNRIVLSHEPVPVTDGTINIHGHLHGSYLKKPNYLNVSIDVINYNMPSMKTINKMLSNLPKDNEKYLEEWYADFYAIADNVKSFRSDMVCDTNGMIVGFGSCSFDTKRRIEVNKKRLLNRKAIYQGKLGKIIKIYNDGEHAEMKMADGTHRAMHITEIKIIGE